MFAQLCSPGRLLFWEELSFKDERPWWQRWWRAKQPRTGQTPGGWKNFKDAFIDKCDAAQTPGKTTHAQCVPFMWGGGGICVCCEDPCK